MIQITKKWFIDSDGRQYILFRKERYFSEKENTWKERQANCSYHTTVSSALSYFVKKMQMKLTKDNDMSLRNAIERFQKIENMVLKSATEKKI